MIEHWLSHGSAHEDRPEQGKAVMSEECLVTAPEKLVSLRAIKKGQKVRIVRVQAYGELGRRIRDMGLVPGTEVEVVGRAPLRDPVALRLPGFTLSLRNNEADYIIVEPL